MSERLYGGVIATESTAASYVDRMPRYSERKAPRLTKRSFGIVKTHLEAAIAEVEMKIRCLKTSLKRRNAIKRMLLRAGVIKKPYNKRSGPRKFHMHQLHLILRDTFIYAGPAQLYDMRTQWKQLTWKRKALIVRHKPNPYDLTYAYRPMRLWNQSSAQCLVCHCNVEPYTNLVLLLPPMLRTEDIALSIFKFHHPKVDALPILQTNRISYYMCREDRKSLPWGATNKEIYALAAKHKLLG
jgi:hypothetical protein